MQEVASIQSGRGLATSMINSWTILGNLCLKVPYSTWKFILIILISVHKTTPLEFLGDIGFGAIINEHSLSFIKFWWFDE